ncbi:MAG TPA: DNA polymerase III subunit delta' [Candidatus Dormibacteraeota bacterium]|nr:DNA polymerase III subunit delta' [Candidatus Dormibacteraeota bacterium]
MSLPVVHGHQATWARLTRLLDAGRLPHALLFLGPPGVGKALVARRLAARLACSAPSAPCDECPGCLQVAAGSHPDLRLIGAPSAGGRKEGRTKKEIGIDQARELKRFVALQAISAARKLAIVDDADRLSIAAQNALLKTLEEPPGQAMLILITASPGALLTTVRSRCQRIAFRPLTDAEVRAALVDAGLAADEAARLAERAEGSPGRALALRASWAADDQAEVRALLAGLEGGRYGSVLAMSKGLGKTEQETVVRLDGLLASCRDDAVAAIAAGDPASLARAVRRGEVVGEALQTLRRRNPNRTLLTEALALRLARD